MKNKDVIVNSIKKTLKTTLILGAALIICIVFITYVDDVMNGVLLDWISNMFVNRSYNLFGEEIQTINWDSIRDFLVLSFVLLVLSLTLFIQLYLQYKEKKLREHEVDYLAEQIQFVMHHSDVVKLPKEYAAIEKELIQLKWELQNKEKNYQEEAQKKNDLIAYLAHDMKTPLASIIGYLSFLDEAKEMNGKQKEKYIAITLDKSYRLESLIDEFFEITRFNINTIVLQKQKVDLYMLLTQLQEEFYPMANEQNKTIELDCDYDITLIIDGDKMARVFNNILKNALAYSDEGSCIYIRVKKDEETIIIAFENTGMKIPKHKLETIFDKFYRLDNARSSKNGGSGLGLAIAKEIVIKHQGEIKAESSLDKTVFTIVLPIKAQEV